MPSASFSVAMASSLWSQRNDGSSRERRASPALRAASGLRRRGTFPRASDSSATTAYYHELLTLLEGEPTFINTDVVHHYLL